MWRLYREYGLLFKCIGITSLTAWFTEYQTKSVINFQQMIELRKFADTNKAIKMVIHQNGYTIRCRAYKQPLFREDTL
jgi:hypothetical protein